MEFWIRCLYRTSTYKNKLREVLPDPNFQAPFLTVVEDGKYGQNRKQPELQMSCRIQCFHHKQDSSKHTDNTNQDLLVATQRNPS
jgi:hypothetical protein